MDSSLFTFLQCAAEADCKLEVVPPLSNVDSTGMAYGIGLSGDHQRINAGLALRLCLAWMEQESPRPLALGNGGKTAGGDVGARPPGSAFAGGEHSGNKGENDGAHGTGPKTPDAPNNSAVFRGREAFLMSLEVHRGLAGCSWPGRCQVGLWISSKSCGTLQIKVSRLFTFRLLYWLIYLFSSAHVPALI